MIDERTKLLVTTVGKLYNRGARKNIQNILGRSHTADIAALLQSLPPEIRYEVFLMEPSTVKRSEILSYLEENEQKELLSLLRKEEVLTLVSLMDKDDAADLLGHLPEEDSKEILSQMIRKDSEEVADLLGYPEDSAGGIMSSEYLAMNQNLTVSQAMEAFQQVGSEDRVTFYLYAINDNDQLVGVISLKQLLLSKKTDTLKSIMYTDVISVSITTHQEDVAKIVERYDFLSLPVVDGNNKLVGVITVDDVIDVIREQAEEDRLATGLAGWNVNVSVFEHFRARAPWLMLSFFGGTLCFMLVYFYGNMNSQEPMISQLWLLIGLLPLMLTLGATAGGQTTTVSVGNIRAGFTEYEKLKNFLVKELTLSLVFSALFFLILLLLGQLLFSSNQLHLKMAVAIALQIFTAMLMGSFIPIIMHRLGRDPTVVSVPLFTTLANLTAMGAALVALNLI